MSDGEYDDTGGGYDGGDDTSEPEDKTRSVLSQHAGDDPQDRRSALIARDRLSALAICAIQDFLCGRDSRLIALRFKGEPGQLFEHDGAMDAREIADFRGHLVWNARFAAAFRCAHNYRLPF
jgi:hypothetical protein